MSSFSRLTRRTMLLALLAAMASPSFAQKGGKPQPPAEPAASGTIFYVRSGSGWSQIMGMKADGSNKQSLPLAQAGATVYGYMSPSDCVHGSDPIQDRWWVFVKVNGYYDEWVSVDGTVSYNRAHYDLFAARSNPANRSQLEVVQLTDLYGVANISPTACCWSNDSNSGPDSFIACLYYDLRGSVTTDFDDEGNPKIRVDLTSGLKSLRLPVTSSDVQQGWLHNDFVPLGRDIDEADLHALIEFMTRQAPANTLTGGSNLSPTGDRVAQMVAAGSTLTPIPGVYVRDFASGELLYQIHHEFHRPHWSRDGQTILLETGFSSTGGGDLLTVPADASSQAETLLRRQTSSTTKGKTTTTTTTGYAEARWAHDSRFLVVKTITDVNGVETQGLARVSPTTGTTVSLNADTGTSTGGTYVRPIRWCSDTPAP